VPLRIFLVDADCVGDVVVIMGDVPYSVLGFEFIALVGAGFEGSGFLRKLGGDGVTLSMSVVSGLL
jgi:hypothetical protein